MNGHFRWGFWRKPDLLPLVIELRERIESLESTAHDLAETVKAKPTARAVGKLARDVEALRANLADIREQLTISQKAIIRQHEDFKKLRAEVKGSQAAVDRRLTAIDRKGSKA